MVEPWIAPLEAGDPEAAWDLFIERCRRLILGAIRHYTAERDDVMNVRPPAQRGSARSALSGGRVRATMRPAAWISLPPRAERNWLNQMDTSYRGELRELNELNFARFDAKLGQRIAEVRADVRLEIGELRADMRAGFAAMNASLDAKLNDRAGRDRTVHAIGEAS